MGTNKRERTLRLRKRIRESKARGHRCTCNLCVPGDSDRQALAAELQEREELQEHEEAT